MPYRSFQEPRFYHRVLGSKLPSMLIYLPRLGYASSLGDARLTVSRVLLSIHAPRRSCMQCMAGQQRDLTNAQRKELRAESQRLGKALVTVNLGKAGMTERFLQSLLDAQAANQLVKVKVGGGCYDDMDTIAEALTRAADCVVVHSIGYTLTLYRDSSLPRRTAAEAAAELALLGPGGAGEGEAASSAAPSSGSPAVVTDAAPGQQQQQSPPQQQRLAQQQEQERQPGRGGGGEVVDEEAGGEAGEGEEAGSGDEDDFSDSDSDEEVGAAGAEEVVVTIGGVKRRIQKPPEFTIIG